MLTLAALSRYLKVPILCKLTSEQCSINNTNHQPVYDPSWNEKNNQFSSALICALNRRFGIQSISDVTNRLDPAPKVSWGVELRKLSVFVEFADLQSLCSIIRCSFISAVSKPQCSRAMSVPVAALPSPGTP